MPENGIRSTWSQCPFQSILKDDNGQISTGTGFFYEYGNESFLLTNWHNVSGKNPISGEYLSASRRMPTKMTLKLANWVEDSNKFAIEPVEYDLYSSDKQTPLWREHPTLGSSCDVVALPIRKPQNVPEFMHNFANRIASIRIPVKPGCQVFITGFPSSLSSGFGLPIWKSGFIASEPAYEVTLGGEVSEYGGMIGGLKVPAFFIDSLTRSGMSGSPVFASYFGNWDTTDPYREINPDEPDFWSRSDVAMSENRMEFVGIYSGRVPTIENEAALGLCWNMSAIDAVCSSTSEAKHPHL